MQTWKVGETNGISKSSHLLGVLAMVRVRIDHPQPMKNSMVKIYLRKIECLPDIFPGPISLLHLISRFLAGAHMASSYTNLWHKLCTEMINGRGCEAEDRE